MILIFVICSCQPALVYLCNRISKAPIISSLHLMVCYISDLLHVDVDCSHGRIPWISNPLGFVLLKFTRDLGHGSWCRDMLQQRLKEELPKQVKNVSFRISTNQTSFAKRLRTMFLKQCKIILQEQIRLYVIN